MTTLRYSPGPVAAETFTLGIATAVITALAGIWMLFLLGWLTLFGAVLATAFGFPVVFVSASCLLGVWLGYDKDATDIALS